MNDRRPLGRKLVYAGCMVALLLVLSWLSPPATTGTAENQGNPGGKLAQLRSAYGLNQSSLGEIDPTSEALKLATLGMRGVAANVLWGRAQHYQRVRDWTSLSATLEQIIKLQPNFVSVWRFQGWNLAYNISADWDDYRDRYYWVKRGINFIRRGTEYNTNEPILNWDTGWFIAQKIGRADERREYRQLFREDDEFHGNRPVAQRDNWLVGKEYFRQAEATHDRLGRAVKGMTPLLFRSDTPKCQINYAIGLEEDGTFGEKAKFAWSQAAVEWEAYGNRDLPAVDGTLFRLEGMAEKVAQRNELMARLMELAPGAHSAIQLEKKMKMSQEERALLDKPEAERDGREQALANLLKLRIEVLPSEIAQRIEGAQRSAADELVKQLDEVDAAIQNIDVSWNVTNYPNWKDRCLAERTDAALAAREGLFEADRAFRDAELQRARDLYLASFQQWRKVLDEYPRMLTDGVTAEETVDAVIRYEKCLRQLDETLPQPFVLDDLLEKQRGYYLNNK